MSEHEKALRRVCAEMYQVAGALVAPVRVLDQLAAAAAGRPLPYETVLPVNAWGWQPIATAPKGESVLIGGGGCPYVHENKLLCLPSGCYWRGLGDRQQPTHWMPLPEPPADA
jgi:hypothetical protein